MGEFVPFIKFSAFHLRQETAFLLTNSKIALQDTHIR